MLVDHTAFAGVSQSGSDFVTVPRMHFRQMWWRRRHVQLRCSHLRDFDADSTAMQNDTQNSADQGVLSSVPRIGDWIYARVRVDGQILPSFPIAGDSAFPSALQAPPLWWSARERSLAPYVPSVPLRKWQCCSRRADDIGPICISSWLPLTLATGLTRAKTWEKSIPFALFAPFFPQDFSRVSVCLSRLGRSATPPVSCGPQPALRF